MGRIRELLTLSNAFKEKVSNTHFGRAVAHYVSHEGNVFAKSMTYAGLLSFIPVIALAVVVISQLTFVFAEPESVVERSINAVVPGLIGEQSGQISLSEVSQTRVPTTIISLGLVLLTGSNWMMAMRTGFNRMVDVTRIKEPSIYLGRLKDVSLLVLFLLVLAASIALSSLVVAIVPIWQRVMAPVLAVVVSAGLFMFLFRFLPDINLGLRRAIRAALGCAVAFEALKIVMVSILGTVSGSAVASIAIAITIAIWIHNFSRIALFGLAWISSDRTREQDS